jgi:hypothetical protein
LCYRKESRFTSDSKLRCPECEGDIPVGTGGEANLQQHIRSRACEAAISKREQKNIPSIRSFFGPKIPQNPPTTSAPPLLHSAVQAVSSSTNRFESATISRSAIRREPCPLAVTLLSRLRAGVERIPNEVPAADGDHPLAVFAGDPTAYSNDERDDWEEVLNPLMKRAFGWGIDGGAVKGVARKGKNGIEGFLNFIEFFVTNRGLVGALIETKCMTLLKAIDDEYVPDIYHVNAPYEIP